MRHHGRIAGSMRQFHRIQRFAQGPDLIDFNEDRIGCSLRYAIRQTLGVGDKQVISDQLYFPTDFLRQDTPTVPIVLRHPILDRYNRIGFHQFLKVRRHTLCIQRFTFAVELIGTIDKEFRGRTVQGQANIVADFVTGSFDRLHNEIQCFSGRSKRRCETAFVPNIRAMSGIRKRAF